MAKKGGSIFTRIFQVILDVASIKKLQRDTQEGLREATDPRAAETNLKKLDKAFTKLKIGAIALATALVAGVALGLRKVIQESIESQKVLAQQEAVLRSTGMAAGRSAQQLQDQANALQKVTTFTDEQVTAAQNLLLTFRQIKGVEFDRATELTLDLATAMGTDATSAALQLGKALQDPIAGLTALRRAGVSFSATQKENIKLLVETGKLAEAQRLILAELEIQFGGSAEAARDTLGGALVGLKNAWGELFEVSRDSTKGVVGLINSIADALPRFIGLVDKLVNTASAVAKGIKEAATGADFQGGEFGSGLIPRTPPSLAGAPGGMGDVRLAEQRDALEVARIARMQEAERIAALEEQEKVNEEIRQAEEGRRAAAEKAHQEQIRAQQERLDFLKEAHAAGLETNEESQQLKAIHDALVAELQKGNVELERRLFLTKEIAAIEEAAINLAPREVTDRRPDVTADIREGGFPGLLPEDRKIRAPDLPDLEEPAKTTKEAWVDALRTVGEEAEITSGLLQAAFDSRGFLAGLAALASAKVKENIARSVETLAGGLAAAVFGDPTKLPIAAKASAGFLGAAALWGAIGGGAGGGGGGGGGSAASARTPAGRGADSFKPQQSITIINYVDGIDPKNGRHQERVGETTINFDQRRGRRITGFTP